MKIALVHDAVADDAAPDLQDTLVQAREIGAALRESGHEVAVVESGLNLEALRDGLVQLAPDCVFNLVESPAGQGSFVHLACAVYEALRLPYTGCSGETVYTTSSKTLAKRMMRAGEVPTPFSFGKAGDEFIAGKFIIKSVWEHASIGIDGSSVVQAAGPGELLAVIAEKQRACGGRFFAERFIHGREFSVSLVPGAGGLEILPPAEMLFNGQGAGAAVLDYASKWDEHSPEYGASRRTFEIDSETLTARLRRIAGRCREVFAVTGPARVDFRVDDAENIYVLEVNANPCLSRDAGYVAACTEAGITYQELIGRILAAAVAPN